MSRAERARSRRPDAAPDDDPAALRAEVAKLAAELEAARAHATALEALALEDPLTGLLNRRGFQRDLARAIAARARYGHPAALLLFDLDRFKAINDTYGHAAGDRALEHVAGLLRRNVRASDTIGRLGGDEFGLVLRQLDEPAAHQKAEALQALLAATPLAIGGLALACESSVGLTMIEADDDPQAAVERADRAMYAQKARRGASRG